MNICVDVRENERIEPLDATHSIIQSVSGYRFGTDAVKLAAFAVPHIQATDTVFDMCSGCGVIGLLTAIATGCGVHGAELDKELWDMSVRSCKLNGLDNVAFTNCDVTADMGLFRAATYDAVVCNPPFYKADSRMRKVAPTANSEITVTFPDIAAAAKRLLKVGGSLFLVHTSSRMDEVLSVCRTVGLTPKELAVNPNGKTFMLRAVRGGKDGLNVSVKEF